MNRLKKIKVTLLGGLLTLMLSSCVYGPGYHHPNSAFYYPYGYYYYPNVSVYFQYSTGFYFYLSNNVWIRTKVLPPYIRLSPSQRIHLDIKSSKPYLYHKQHTEQYRPRPNYKPAPQLDRKERNTLQHWYQQQLEYKKEKRDKEKNKRRD